MPAIKQLHTYCLDNMVTGIGYIKQLHDSSAPWCHETADYQDTLQVNRFDKM